MKNKDLEELKKKYSIHEIIVDLLNSLSAVRGLSEIKNQVINEKELIGQALGILIQNQDMERCSFFYLEDEWLVNVTGISSYEENTNAKRHHSKPIRFKLGDGVIGLAAKTKELQNCSDTLKDPRFQQSKNAQSLMPGSIISAPVIVSDKVLGVLNISHPETDYFSQWHVRLLQIYKNMLGQLITNSRLYKSMEDQIATRTEKLEIALTEVRLLKERYESLSMLDELTGLYNRRYFYNQVEIAFSSAIRYGQSLCFLILDIDFFKKINDTHGHLCGDQVLINVATLLDKQMRDSDILVRFGGEEFVVIFTNTECTNGRIFAERIREEVEALTTEYNQVQVKTTISIGVYCVNQEEINKAGSNVDNLVRNADIALFKAKSKGRNRVEVYTDQMRKDIEDSQQ